MCSRQYQSPYLSRPSFASAEKLHARWRSADLTRSVALSARAPPVAFVCDPLVRVQRT